jgi:serine/threonine protein kinase
MSASPVHSASPKRCPSCKGRFPADFRVCPRDATPLEEAPEDADPLIGSVLSNTYEIGRTIGEGGMGRVYEAVHQRLHNRRYAIKVLHHEHARQPDVVSRFQREAEAASALAHPNVLEVYDVNRTPDGRPYIVSELLEGEELGRHLERLGRLELAAGIGIVRQICRALGAAHARGVVHRDMKPENVFLVTESGAPGMPSTLRAKVIDFGISKVGDSKGTLTKTGVVIGTPAYMPPEQARGNHVDHRADIYAVGAILYRVLTGQKPFDGGDVVATLTSVVVDEPTRPSTIERTISPGLELVIQKAMAKDPGERYASLAELEAALAEHDPAGALSSPSLQPALAQPEAGTARTLLDATPRPGSSASVEHRIEARVDSRNIAGARSSLVLWSVGGALWVFLGLIDSLASTVRLLRGKGDLTATEMTLSVGGALALLLTPAVFWVRHLNKRVWPSTPRAVDTAVALRKALIASCVAYGLCMLGGHVFSTLINPQLGFEGWLGWPVLAYVAALLSLVTSWMMRRSS